MQGIITKLTGGFYTVVTDGEHQMVTCRARGRFRLEGASPLVGDRVDISLQEDGSGRVDEILPRRSAFIRPPLANIDQMMIVASGATPRTDPFLIDRMSAIAVSREVQPVLCINKCDLDPADDLWEIYRKTDIKTLRLSAETGQGIDELRGLLAAKLSAFTGNSGVGKSSLLNLIYPELSLLVGDVSERLGRGRHTTRHVELFKLPNGGLVADTPGFSTYEEDLKALDAQSLAEAFVEFRPFIDGCRFVGCAHVKDKGCAVVEAVEQGTIHPQRHESYVRLLEMVRQVKKW